MACLLRSAVIDLFSMLYTYARPTEEPPVPYVSQIRSNARVRVRFVVLIATFCSGYIAVVLYTILERPCAQVPDVQDLATQHSIWRPIPKLSIALDTCEMIKAQWCSIGYRVMQGLQ